MHWLHLPMSSRGRSEWSMLLVQGPMQQRFNSMGKWSMRQYSPELIGCWHQLDAKYC